ncbi:GntR family transcriptional regulator [Nocardia terpenica]|uniref:GntR family transcriptional regulator n=1 Tax=Nocardia terpenica TaxID=455432 RepID=A0A164JGZ0_9NOCA|nr:GntR family transcriptional regulator [Nocardia terpenica]KZM70395.1 GntR family transcriptional regulator [Nocardia terpenica]NQE91077.1 GntR family transcriptional regulator [Nocardia terpenica]
MSPSLDRPAPPYLQIADHFRVMIKNGELSEGAKLPSVAEIAAGWNIATATAAKALNQLRTEGYVRSTPRGTFVSISHKQTTGPDRLQMLRATGNGYRPGESVEVVSSELTDASNDVTESLGIPEGTQVVRRRRVYRDDLGIVTISTSWLPGEFAKSAPELLSTDPLPKMTFGLIEDRTGRRAVARRDVVSLREAPTDIAETLGVEPNSQCLTMTNLYWDQNGDPTEYAIDYLGPGRELSAEYSLD